jgi:poly-gamma-glutamate capsule biosynthesis protein CapA/YwtB (metallophosphatase superfamily)
MKYLNKIVYPLVLISLLIAGYVIDGQSKSIKPLRADKDSVISVRISVVGDLMCHSPQIDYAKKSDGTYDFSSTFREVKKYFAKTDFLFGNLETVTAGKQKPFIGYPLFNTPDEYISALKDAGFNLLTTANNHAVDQGESGILRTIEMLKKNGLNYNGTFSSQRDRDSIRIFNIKGIKIAFLGYTFDTNGNPVTKGKSYLINLIDFNLIKNDIYNARKQGAEIVLVHYHFGVEYQREPVKEQREVVNKTIQLGADIIIGGHPHVIEPVDYFKASPLAKLNTGFVIYSMGNFVSNQQWRYSDAGLILNIDISKNVKKDSLYIAKVDYIPTWVYKGARKGKNEYAVLPIIDPEKIGEYSFVPDSGKAKMRQAFGDTKEILAKYSKNISVYNEK